MNLKQQFEEARKAYPGIKRGLEPEWRNFEKKHRGDIANVTCQLLPAIEKQIEWRRKLKQDEKFCPEWKHFKTWLNQECWTLEVDETIEQRIEKQEIDLWKARIREQYFDYLNGKSTEELNKLRYNGGQIKAMAGWLIDEILENRKELPIGTKS